MRLTQATEHRWSHGAEEKWTARRCKGSKDADDTGRCRQVLTIENVTITVTFTVTVTVTVTATDIVTVIDTVPVTVIDTVTVISTLSDIAIFTLAVTVSP